MHLPNNLFAITLILSGLVTVGVSWAIFKRTGGAVRWFGYMMLSIAIWAIAYGCELSSYSLTQMLFWINFEYFGIAFAPTLWIVFVIGFTGKEHWLTPLNRFLIFLEPSITLLMVWTNHWHHLHYASVGVDNSGPFPLLAITTGIWYKIHTVYFYSMLGWGMYLIISRFRKADEFIKKQNRIILFGAFIPWLINLSYLLNLRPFGHLDLTPFAFIASSLIISIGLLGFKLFDVVPIARGKIVDALQEGILVFDTQNRVIDINPEMRKILPPNINHVIGKSAAHLFPGFTELNDAVHNQENSWIEIKLDDGRIFAVTLTSLFERQTIYSGKIMLFRDITERKQSEEKLQELNQLKDRLFSIISHDLRTPLLSLMDILSMNNDGMVSDEEFRSFLPTLTKNIGYTSGLVENLLQWSKSQLEGTIINGVHFDIKDNVTYLVSSFAQLAADKGISIKSHIYMPTMVFADMDMVQAVLRNLLSNAIKFCRAGDKIIVDAEVRRDTATIWIADTGVGIASENLSKLFGNNNFTTRGTTNEQGTGLGLLLCKDFIEKNCGRIWVESTQGHGSSFYFTLPTDPA
ncbi:histidine kinase N-terminal 7TM domain-containing protein [Mucilaginibacter sp. dw_454]|uniref:sensor histidine kinase n=1 Tax=Mucilaginibacter sp. dw_454 TaxID=2720079 RepID=UPI001BD33615|nr:histidine kinase N-terminal 7TM domain-containing protein [Mucilaginibacter sp. dw_454]